MRTGGRILGSTLVELLLLGGVAHARTRLFLASEPGDFVGAGREHSFSSADGAFTTFHQGSYVRVSFSAVAAFESWTLAFAVPAGKPFVPGDYVVPARGGFDEASLDVSGEGRGATEPARSACAR